MGTTQQVSALKLSTNICGILLVLAVSIKAVLKRALHLGCINPEGCHYQAGSTTKHYCTSTTNTDASRQCTLQMRS